MSASFSNRILNCRTQQKISGAVDVNTINRSQLIIGSWICLLPLLTQFILFIVRQFSFKLAED